MPSFIVFVYAIIFLFGVIAVILNMIITPVGLGYYGIDYLDRLLNPFRIYRRRRVNKFGSILASIFHNIFFFLHAIWFWVYKACTVGI